MVEQFIFEHSVRTIDRADNVPLKVFRSIDEILRRHLLDRGAVSRDVYYHDGRGGRTVVAKVYGLDNLTLIDERHRDCQTRPSKIRSDDDDVYINTVRISILYTGLTVAGCLIDELKLLRAIQTNARP